MLFETTAASAVPLFAKPSVARRLWRAAVLLGCAAGLAGCGGSGLSPCDTPERRAQAAQVAMLPPAVRDSIARAFTDRSRIRSVAIEQRDCHLCVTVRVDSFAGARYASQRGFALIRALKENAPGETRPSPARSGDAPSEVGTGIYGYAVTFERAGASPESSALRADSSEGPVPWVRLTKPYDTRHVTVRE